MRIDVFIKYFHIGYAIAYYQTIHHPTTHLRRSHGSPILRWSIPTPLVFFLHSEYVSNIRHLTEVAGDQRAELLSLLLEGYDESDGRVATILRNAGYLARPQSFCVVLAQSVNPAEMLNPSRARRLANSVEQLLQSTTIKRLIDIRNNNITMVLSDVRRASGWTAPTTTLAKRISSTLSTLGNAVLIGISNDVPSTSNIPMAYREATLALELANVTQRIVQFADLRMNSLLLHIAGEDIQRVFTLMVSSLL